MNKEKFLAELREYLSVLENQEQDDICAEYAQHIDMKIQKGLSEEEAIRDFGPVEQLAAEILEAYHVNPEFRRQGFLFKMPKLGAGAFRSPMQSKTAQGVRLSQDNDDNAQEEKARPGGIGGRVKNIMAGAAHRIGNVFRWIGGKCRALAGHLAGFFTRSKGETDGNVQERTMERKRTRKMTAAMGSACRMTGRGIAALWRGFKEFCIFWLKFMWNAAWLLFALICAGMAMLTLLGAGAIVVFLVQGYPFIGLFLMCLGGLLCFGALAYGSFSLLIRKKGIGGDDNRRDAAAELDESERQEAEGGCGSRREEITLEYDKEAAYEQTT